MNMTDSPGTRIKYLRQLTGLSQEELGYKLNVTRQTVSKWELGQTTPEITKAKDGFVEIGNSLLYSSLLTNLIHSEFAKESIKFHCVSPSVKKPPE